MAAPGGDVPAADGTSGRVKRVLHVGKFYPPVSGGMERVVESLCLVSAGLVESSVLVTNTGRTTVREEITNRAWSGYPAARPRSPVSDRSAPSGRCTSRPTSSRSCAGRAPISSSCTSPTRGRLLVLRSGASASAAGDLVPQRRRAPGTAVPPCSMPRWRSSPTPVRSGFVVSSQPLADHADRAGAVPERVSRHSVRDRPASMGADPAGRRTPAPPSADRDEAVRSVRRSSRALQRGRRAPARAARGAMSAP